MATDYEEIYRQTPHALGAPNKDIVGFFKTYSKRSARVLDVGCGQGRDALSIARLGHQVVGVDLAPSGVDAFLTAGAKEQLKVEGYVADLRDYVPVGQFDVIVLDRTLHMLDVSDRHAVFRRLITHVPVCGHVLIVDEKRNIPGLREILQVDSARWAPSLEKGGLHFVKKEA